ncbi:MAG TPA: sigma-70 family RNA polymerase sigma factor [Kofleriaceae bacterium]|nr:sigma-70 family RNA polymerase sigma factor [Kofleriaceae bacterium]
MDSDRALLAAWARGDRAAGATLLERYYAPVARFFHNKVSGEGQEDLIHDTFAALQKREANLREQGSFRAFLFSIARGVLTDHLRRITRHQARLDPELELDELPATSFGLSPVADAVEHEEQPLLLEALRRIPLNHQIALELHYWEAPTTEEMAEVLGIPASAVKTQLRDGRAHLEAQLAKLARSPEALKSTLDDLEQWARRTRAQIGPAPGGGMPARRRLGGTR